jgi:N-acetylmuramate 1-kinase
MPITLEPIARGGSDRTFTRCRIGGRRFICMHYGMEREENALYVPIGRFLAAIGIRTPEIVADDPTQRLVLLEDLGDRDLWSQRDAPWDVRRVLYTATLAMAARLHTLPPGAFPAAEVRLMPAFDDDLFRWERDYFRQQFVQGVCGLAPECFCAAALEEELAALARRIMEVSPCLIHRDLQSQNIMIVHGGAAWIDFQGMRRGSPFYDVASLLYDPYVSFTEEERLFLLRTYADEISCDAPQREPDGKRKYNDVMPGAGFSPGMRWPDFVTSFREATVQRLMQALGAYGFLGVKQGKRAFLAHIPRALDHLELAAAPLSGLPRLKALVEQCRTAINDVLPCP